MSLLHIIFVTLGIYYHHLNCCNREFENKKHSVSDFMN